MRSIEEDLVDLAEALEMPTGATVAAAVSARLRSTAAPPRFKRWAPRNWAVIFAVSAALVGGAAAAPAVANWFGVRGVDISRRPPAPPVSMHVAGHEFDLGTAARSIDDAAAAAGFRPVVPASLGVPKAIWVDRRGALPFVSLVYNDVLVSEFDASIAENAIVSKFAREDTVIEELEVNGERAVWIDGVHDVVLRGRDGRYAPEALRLSDAVLLVEHGRLTVRIETDGGRATAIGIARSLPSNR